MTTPCAVAVLSVDYASPRRLLRPGKSSKQANIITVLSLGRHIRTRLGYEEGEGCHRGLQQLKENNFPVIFKITVLDFFLAFSYRQSHEKNLGRDA